jgi:branched-chain amino acid transport system ATP-binding protein
MNAPILETRDVVVRFGGVTAVDGVTLAVEPGELLGLIGPNGAGKTTLLKAITGVVRPQEGTIRLENADITGLAVHQRGRRGIGLSHQIVRPFRSMTPLQNVMLAAGGRHTRHPLGALLRSDRRAEEVRARELLGLVGIAEAAENETASLPLGYLKRLEVARALATGPRVLLLDEPLAGLNSVEAGRLADTIAELNRQGLSIVLIEHNLSEVMRVASRLFVLDNGRRIASGAPREVMDDAAVRAAYMGAGEVEDAAA